MNNSPRCRVRVLPPLRGRLAAEASPRLKQRYSEPTTYQTPLAPKSCYNGFSSSSCHGLGTGIGKPVKLASPDCFDRTLIGWLIIF